MSGSGASATSSPARRTVVPHKVWVDAIVSGAAKRHREAAEPTDATFAGGGDIETLFPEAKELVKIIHKESGTVLHTIDGGSRYG